MGKLIEFLQAVALAATITRTALEVMREVKEMRREHKHDNG